MRTSSLGLLAGPAIAMAILAFSAPMATAQSTPDATIDFNGGSVGIIAGVSWGGGTLHFKGKTYRLRVSGLNLGSVGAKSFQARGEVFNLRQASDINGTYAAGSASATVAGGAGALEMKNGNGVVIRATSTSAGLHLGLGPSGVTIQLR